MVLQFHPPEDIVNAYLNRPSQTQEVSSGIQAILEMYAKQKQAEQQRTLQKHQTDVADFNATKDYLPEDQVSSAARSAGLNIPSTGAVPPTPSTGTAPSSTAGMPDAQGESVSQAPSSLVQAHAQTTGFNPLGLPIPTSKAGLAKYKEKLDIQKKENDLQKPPKGPEGYYDPQTGQKKFELPSGSHLVPVADTNMGLRESQQQDKLEEQYRKSFQQVRGDPSIKRAEEQRDAAAVAYNRIQEVKDHGQILNPIDYVDVLGQIYKARTGSAPTNEVLSEARQATAKGNFGKAFTFVTGEQAPATTEDIMSSLQDMARSMGEQADKFHDGYMRSRMNPPKGLAHDRVSNVVAERGMSFAEATKAAEKQSVSTGGWKYIGPKE